MITQRSSSLYEYNAPSKMFVGRPFFIVSSSPHGGTQLYADDVNLLGDNIDTIKRNAQTLIDASKEIGLEVNTEKPLGASAMLFGRAHMCACVNVCARARLSVYIYLYVITCY
jgi:hypothetical protein